MANESSLKANHENFLVTTTELTRNSQPRLKLVRQDRYEIKELDCYVTIKDKKFEVLNYSQFGIALCSEERFDVDPEYHDVPFFLENTAITRLALKKVREEKMPDSSYKVAFEILGEPLNITRVEALLKATEVVNLLRTTQKEEDGVPENFKRLVYEVKDCLERLEVHLNDLSEVQEFVTNFDVQVFEKAVSEVVASYLNEVMDPGYQALASSLAELPPDRAKLCFEFFRKKLKDLIYESPLSDRIFKKPLGYAGDHETINIIYRNESLGKTLFAKCLNYFYATHPNAQAVRNRSNYLFDKLQTLLSAKTSKEAPRILSVACGPAREIQMLQRSSCDFSKATFHLLDQDLSALRSAQRSTRAIARETGKEINAHFLHKAIKNVLIEGLPEKYDLIYAAGLFDYFSDPVAKMAAKKLFGCLNEGGSLIIGNFTAVAKYKALMELALDWNLIYRTEKDLMGLYSDISPKLTVEVEPKGINLFVVITK